jgi:hypothetical protein
MVLEGVNDGTFLGHTLTVKSPPITTKKLIEALLCRLQPDLSLTERVVLSARANAHVPRISLSVSLFHDYFLPDLIRNILPQSPPRSFTKQEMLSASFLIPPFLNAGNPLVSLCFIYYIQCGGCRAGARGRAPSTLRPRINNDFLYCSTSASAVADGAENEERKMTINDRNNRRIMQLDDAN